MLIQCIVDRFGDFMDTHRVEPEVVMSVCTVMVVCYSSCCQCELESGYVVERLIAAIIRLSIVLVVL